MLKLLLGTFVCGALFVLVQGQYDDVRCKCVCPSVFQNKSSTPTRNVFLRQFNEPSSCKCKNVVDQAIQKQEYKFCDRCECQWQRRNTTTIKVVVILIICIVSMLFLYMLFLLCLDPLMSLRPKNYIEQRNEEVNMDTQSIQPGGMLHEDGARPRGAIIARVRNEVSRVHNEQQKWKGTVQEQRKNIFDRHTMLN